MGCGSSGDAGAGVNPSLALSPHHLLLSLLLARIKMVNLTSLTSVFLSSFLSFHPPLLLYFPPASPRPSSVPAHLLFLSELILLSPAVLGQLTEAPGIEISLPQPWEAPQAAELRPACFCILWGGLQYPRQERYEVKRLLFRAKGRLHAELPRRQAAAAGPRSEASGVVCAEPADSRPAKSGPPPISKAIFQMVVVAGSA